MRGNTAGRFAGEDAGSSGELILLGRFDERPDLCALSGAPAEFGINMTGAEVAAVSSPKPNGPAVALVSAVDVAIAATEVVRSRLDADGFASCAFVCCSCKRRLSDAKSTPGSGKIAGSEDAVACALSKPVAKKGNCCCSCCDGCTWPSTRPVLLRV